MGGIGNYRGIQCLSLMLEVGEGIISFLVTATMQATMGDGCSWHHTEQGQGTAGSCMWLEYEVWRLKTVKDEFRKASYVQLFEQNAEEFNFYSVGDEEPLNDFEENERMM